MKTVRAGAFTVIELLAVLTVVGLLGILVFPIWASNAAEARTARCAENLRGIGQAAGDYANNNHGKFPGSQHLPPTWSEGLERYCGPEKFLCSEILREKRTHRTYALNDFLTPSPYGARHLDFSRVASVPSPGETMMFGEVAEAYRLYDHFHFADAVDNGFSPEAFGEQVDVERHDASANYLFVDAHVELLGWSSGAKPKLKFAGSKFVHPAGEPTGQQLARR